MISRSRRTSPSLRIRATHWAVALALGAFVGSVAAAASVGHSRIVSAPGAPMRVVVPLEHLTSDEQSSLVVSVPALADWQRAGVVPPVPIDSLRASIEPGSGPTHRVIRLESSQPVSTATVDVLLDLRSGSGSRQIQVSILAPQRASATPVQSATLGDVDASRDAAPVRVTVRAGENLFRIARRHEVPDANIIQMLVAIWRANPEAFIQNNMNLLRAGERLTIPDAAAVRSVSPAQAQRIYLQHLEDFAHYRGRAGAQVANAAPAGSGQRGEVGRVTAASSTERNPASINQDRLQLSASGSVDARQDSRTSAQHALQDARHRVETLEGNVQALSEVAASQTPAGAEGAQGGAGAMATPEAAGQGRGTVGVGATPTPQASGTDRDAAQASSADAPVQGSGASSSGEPAHAAAGASHGVQAQGASGAPRQKGAAPVDGVQDPDAAQSASTTPDTASGRASHPDGASVAAGTIGMSGTSSRPATQAEAQDLAAASGKTGGPTDADTGNWFTDNLLAIVTAALALLVLVIAWVMRRAGARRADEHEEGADGEAVVDTAALTRKLEGIDLNLDTPPSDEPSTRDPRR